MRSRCLGKHDSIAPSRDSSNISFFEVAINAGVMIYTIGWSVRNVQFVELHFLLEDVESEKE